MNSRIGALWLALAVLHPAAADLPSIQTRFAFDGLDRFRISWDAQVGEAYMVQTSTNLAAPWQDMVPEPGLLVAATNLIDYTHTVTNEVRFFRVAWLDTKGPRLTPVYPRFEGIAVPRDSALESRLWDETSIDTNSIQFVLGEQPPITLADARLGYTNQVLTYRPGSTETLGEWGQNVTATVVASDLAGNRTTNLWPFQLELQTVLSTNILVVGGPGPRSPSLASPGGLTLVSRNGFLLVYRYTGGSSGLRNGMHLIDATPGQGYALTVLAFTEDPPNHTVSVWTQSAALADLIQEGSVSTRNAQANPSAGAGQHVWWEAGMDLDFSHKIPLEATLYEWQQDANYVRAELTDASRLELEARAGFAANFRNFTLKEIEFYAAGRAALDLELYAEANYQKHFGGTNALIAPVYGHFVIPVAGIPVEVTTKFEADLIYLLDFQAHGQFRNGIKVSKEIYLGRKWDGSWHDTSRYPPADFQWTPPDWQVTGTLNARADLKPKITALLYGAAGLYADLDPYLELEGWGQLNPWQYRWALYGGLDAHLGSDLTVFDRLFPELSFEIPFTLIPKTWITGADNLVEAPEIVMHPQSRSVSVGGTAGFSVRAEGTEPLSYQWQRDGVNLSDGGRISGSHSAVLRLSDVRLSDAGGYRVVVSNAGGGVTSAEATLSVGEVGPAPSGMVLIPAGAFEMGDTFKEGSSNELPVHTVDVSAFYMDKYEVTKALWDEVYQWGVGHGYSFDNRGSSKGTTHPVHLVSWYDCVKWCNARSEKEGRVPAYYTSAARTTVYRTGQVDVENDWVKWDSGYRLPTEAEWEKAARGGSSGKRFPWGDTISHSQANYQSDSSYSYDVSPTRDYHPDYDTGGEPYTSPVGSFAPNGYGLHDMTGNVWEWCWDWYAHSYYGTSPSSDPRGASGGSRRVIRGGGWIYYAWYCRVTYRYYFWAFIRLSYLGFRSVLPPGQ